MKKLVFPVLLLLCTLLLFGCASKTRTIELKGNITTGYQWDYTMSQDGIIKEISNEYKDGNIPGTVGAGGIFKFTFEGVSEGSVELYFQYHRSWEEDAEPASSVTYLLTVDKNGNIIGKNPTGATLDGRPIKDVVEEKLVEKS